MATRVDAVAKREPLANGAQVKTPCVSSPKELLPDPAPWSKPGFQFSSDCLGNKSEMCVAKKECTAESISDIDTSVDENHVPTDSGSEFELKLTGGVPGESISVSQQQRANFATFTSESLPELPFIRQPNEIIRYGTRTKDSLPDLSQDMAVKQGYAAFTNDSLPELPWGRSASGTKQHYFSCTVESLPELPEGLEGLEAED